MLFRSLLHATLEKLRGAHRIVGAQGGEGSGVQRFQMVRIGGEHACKELLGFRQAPFTQQLPSLLQRCGVRAHRPAELAYALLMASPSPSSLPGTDLRYYLRTYDAHLEPALCEKLIASFNALSRFQQQNGRNIRADALADSSWTELNVTRLSDAGFLTFFRSRIDHALEAYNRDVQLPIPVPNSAQIADLVLKRYRPGHEERFQLHFDAVNHLANRYLVMLWYLNDVAGGGETRFPQLDIAVAPKAGRLIVFPPYWMYQHEGLMPVSCDKYILSTYLLFPAPQAS